MKIIKVKDQVEGGKEALKVFKEWGQSIRLSYR